MLVPLMDGRPLNYRVNVPSHSAKKTELLIKEQVRFTLKRVSVVVPIVLQPIPLISTNL